MPILIRLYPDTPSWPERAEGITDAEVEKLLKAGEIEHVEQQIYREKRAQGYQTKVMVATADVAVAPEPEPEPEDETEDWRKHRKAVAEALDKDARKVTKAEVEEYLAAQED
jgi:hypothetical protein